MPSARPSKFSSGGFLKDVDGTIVNLQFSNALPGQAEPAVSDKGFHSFFANLTIQVDGAEATTTQALFVGDAEKFAPTESGHGVTGDGQFSKSSGWFIFLDSLVKAGFDETVFPDDDPDTADYTAIVGARARFSQQVNAELTKRRGQRVDKKDPKKKYDRTDLIVTAYYGNVDVVVPKVAPARVVKTAAKVGKVNGKVNGAAKKAFDPSLAIETVITAVASTAKKDAEGNIDLSTASMSKSKLGIKILTLLSTTDPGLRNDVREWSDNGDNLAGIEGIIYNPATQMLTLSE